MEKEARFRFGRNWRGYARHIHSAAVNTAADSVVELIGPFDDRWHTFLDIGCGSGIFSAAATRLGLSVLAFDYDADSVETTRSTLSRFASKDMQWRVEEGDILDSDYIATLPRSDIVYAWGVLHHTGDMWKALEHAAALVEPNGVLVVALYNDQGWVSAVWRVLKKLYVRYRFLRPVLLLVSFVRFWGRSILKDTVRRRDPMYSWREYAGDTRSMSAWHDLVDWVGGYPFEVATPGEVERTFKDYGLSVERSLLVGDGSGNNQFVARRVD